MSRIVVVVVIALLLIFYYVFMMQMMLLLLLLFFINDLFNMDNGEFGIGLFVLSCKEISIDVKFAGVAIKLKILLFHYPHCFR